MGLTSQSTGSGALKEMLDLNLTSPDDIIVALAGNPNTGKSTVFNSLTGLNQHTGNWTGKTVTTAQGNYKFKDKNFILVDLPGTYSLLSNSAEEEIARDFICFANPHATVVVTDATSLQRNLNLVLQILEMTDRVVVCVNLMDEAKRKKIHIDINKLSKLLGVPVIGTNARDGEGLDDLMEAVFQVSQRKLETNPLKVQYNEFIENEINSLEKRINSLIGDKVNNRWLCLKLLDNDKTILNSINKYIGFDIEKKLTCLDNIDTTLDCNCKSCSNCSIKVHDLRDEIVENIVKLGEEISNKVVRFENKHYNDFDRKIDNILTSKIFGIPIMICMLAIIFWITIVGANYPSEALANMFGIIEDKLTYLFLSKGWPEWLHGVLVLGVYKTLAWVISVMLPPMAIFFPLFTLLEDLGYLPRVAFNLDNFFKKACTHGKQALTMCMGFGCNAAGVVGCRIIDSPRERLIAIITNFFVPCNGRFPTLIAITTIFIAGSAGNNKKSLIATLTITGIIVFGVIMTLLVSKILSKTLLKGVPSSFTLELPPYRKPQIGRIIVRSILDRTIFVLGRAIIVAAPAGLVIWIFANIKVGNMSILTHAAEFLDPFAHLIGMDGYILMAFILGLPANEIVMPILIMSYMATGSMLELENLSALRDLLVSNGWTLLTAINVMLFCLMHFPCATTLLTIKKETKSLKWTLVSFLVPTIAGISICFVFTQFVRLIGLA
ncbi:ferrous iron transport protein B [Clostridium tetanomorphum]|uniref:ferrous iron transport protein B n=1 Tax=Clostridium tetanomorphum TaxID=1553 RepID=UPI000452BAA1|nr:ferrous iron transport protein B [Clostridium tetanomorphum]KAJ51992.1 ferrous iron transporter FeoB [Clostridium tetanomorphum DSM 665]MBP1862912.1 ferrous iron transport protein B [Clostridium tetanomorphum]NRS87049.1 ferrous iron transport protein B [Clostridium tetanomorphum]SQC00143.1 ferrous iron transporter FeoB [Clostridium tetanomorphum]